MHDLPRDAWSAAVAALAQARPIVLTDEAHGTSDLVLAAATVTAGAINLLTTHGRGLLALALPAARVARLRLAPMAATWDSPAQPFTISIEAREGVSTGISAPDRARTIRAAVAPDARPDDLVAPGHVFPLRARPGGILGGGGRVEAALELGTAAGSPEGAVLMEILDDDGALATPAQAAALAHRLGVPQVTLARVAHQARVAAVATLEARGASGSWRQGLAWARKGEPSWR